MSAIFIILLSTSIVHNQLPRGEISLEEEFMLMEEPILEKTYLVNEIIVEVK